MRAIWTKWRYNNFLSENWQCRRHMSLYENCMSNNVAAILNFDIAAIWWQFPRSDHFPTYKESLFSFQSAIGNEVQSNVKHMAAILKSNMAAPGRKFWDCQNVPRHRKHRYRHYNVGPRCNRTGDMGKIMVIWRHIGNQYGGHQGSQIFGVYFF